MMLPKKSFHVGGGEFNAAMMAALKKKKKTNQTALSVILEIPFWKYLQFSQN